MMKSELSEQTLESVARAVTLLQNGEVVAIPTETVYGLAARISDDSAIRKIFSTKNRPFFDPLIVHVASIPQAQSLVAHWPGSAQLLAETFWPGPLTLVLPKNDRVSDLITSGLETVGLRFPRHPLAQLIIEKLQEPVAAPSANRFGHTSPSEAEHVRTEFEDRVTVVDGGPCDVGIESTIIKVNESEARIEITFLRAGSILPDQIQKVLKRTGKDLIMLQPGHNIEAPGQVKHHYMPTIPVVSVSRRSWDQLHGDMASLNKALRQNFAKPCLLQLNSSPEQAARELYGQLRICSRPPADVIIFVKEPHQTGEAWTAILDRLHRASSFHLD
jgi:L-threonylcarbamoyladenylate synthase